MHAAFVAAEAMVWNFFAGYFWLVAGNEGFGKQDWHYCQLL